MTVPEIPAPITPAPVAPLREHAGIEKIQATMKKCADGIVHVSELAAHVEAQGGWDGLATTREHMRLLASNLTTVAAVQQRTLDLIVMLLGTAGRIKEQYAAVLHSIDETGAAHPESAEVAEYLAKLRSTVTQIKEQDERLESIVAYTHELRDTIDTLARSLSSQAAENRARFGDAAQAHETLRDHLQENIAGLARSNEELKRELAANIDSLETALESLAERQRSAGKEFLQRIDTEKGERAALRSDLQRLHADGRAALDVLRKETSDQRAAALAGIQQKFDAVQKTLEQKIDLIHSYMQSEVQGGQERLADALKQENAERQRLFESMTQGSAKAGGDIRASITREIALAEERLRRSFEELFAIMEDRVQSSLQQASEALAQETAARAGAFVFLREELEVRFQEHASSLSAQQGASDARQRQELQTLESAADSRFRALEERLGHALRDEKQGRDGWGDTLKKELAAHHSGLAATFDGKLNEQREETQRRLAESVAHADARVQSSFQALEALREEMHHRLGELAALGDTRAQSSLEALTHALEEETCLRQQGLAALRDELVKQFGENSHAKSSEIERRLGDLSTQLAGAFSQDAARRDEFMGEVVDKFEQARRQHTADLAAVLQREREVQTSRADEIQNELRRQEEAWRDRLHAMEMQHQQTFRWGVFFLGMIGVLLLLYVLRGL